MFPTISNAATMHRFFRGDATTILCIRSAQMAAWATLVVSGLGLLALLMDGQGAVSGLSGAALILGILTLIFEGVAQVRKPSPGAAERGFYDYHVKEMPILARMSAAELKSAIPRAEAIANTVALVAAGVVFVMTAAWGHRITVDTVLAQVVGQVLPPAMLGAGYLLLVEHRKKYRRALE